MAELNLIVVEEYVGVGVRHLRRHFPTNLACALQCPSLVRKVLEVLTRSGTSHINFDGGSGGQERSL